MKVVLQILGMVLSFLSIICSALFMRLIPIVAVVLIITDLTGVTAYGILTIILYGVLSFIGCFALVLISGFILALLAEI